jgi:hypothetical protein
MALEFYYSKNGHTYKETARSYADLDKKMKEKTDKGYMIVGANFYH